MKPLYYASGLVFAFVLGGVTVRPLKATVRSVAPVVGYGDGIEYSSWPSDHTPASMGWIGCDISGNGTINNFYFGPTGLHGARLIVSGQCNTKHGPHPRNPQ